MRISANHTMRYLAAALAVIGLAPAAALAAGGPVGEWDISVLAEGQETPATLTIVEADGEYSGALVSDLGEMELTEVRYEDGELQFTMEIPDFGIFANFTGTIDGDSLEGKFVIEDMAMELPTIGTRAGGTPAIVGTWKLMVDSQLGNNPRDLVVKADMTGTYGGGDFGNFAISNVKIDGDVVQFDVTLSLEGQELPCKVTLTLDGNKVKGKLDFGQGEAAIVGVKVDNSLVGTWAMAGESEGTGAIERTWVFNDDMTGKYSGDIGSFDITNVKVEGKVVTFDVTLEVQGQELPSKFTGTLEGGVLSGELN